MPKLSLSLLEKNPTLYAINLDEINGMDADFVARLQAEGTTADGINHLLAQQISPALALLHRFITLIAPNKPQATWLGLPPAIQKLVHALTAQCEEEANALDTHFSSMAINRPTAPIFDDEKQQIRTVESLSPTRETDEAWNESEFDQEEVTYQNPFERDEDDLDELPTLTLERKSSHPAAARPTLFQRPQTKPTSTSAGESFIEQKSPIHDQIAMLEPQNKRPRRGDAPTAKPMFTFKSNGNVPELLQQLKQFQQDLHCQQDLQQKRIDIYRSLALKINKVSFYRSTSLTGHKQRLADVQQKINHLQDEIGRVKMELMLAQQQWSRSSEHRSFTPSPSVSPVFNENTPPEDQLNADLTINTMR